MKIVINNCYGGFSLSPLATKMLAKLKGRECFFFKGGMSNSYEPCDPESEKSYIFLTAFDIPNPNEVKDIHGNEAFNKHYVTNRPDDRTDPDLIRVVEELGRKADGPHAQLKIVEIPDGVEWEIDEYDGIETIDEKHRSWS